MASGPTIAHAQIEVDYDGSRLEGEAARLAKKAGKGSGFAFTDGFNDGLNAYSRDLTKNLVKKGQAGGEQFAKAMNSKARAELAKNARGLVDAIYSKEGFARFARSVGGSQKAVEELNSALARLRDSGDLSKRSYDKMRAGLQRWANELHLVELATEREAAAARKAAEDKVAANAKLRLEQEALRESNRRLSDSLRDINAHLTNSGWRTLVTDSEDAGKAMENLRTEIDRLNQAGKLTDTQTRVLHGRMRDLASSSEELAVSTDRAGDAAERSNKKWGDHASVINNIRNSYRRMDGTVKLVIGSILAAGDQIAALGPALGVGVTVLGGALASVVVGAAGAIAVFSNLGGEIDKLPAEVRPAARAFQGLGKVFGDLRDEIQIAALEDAEDAFKSIGDTVKGLTGPMKTVGRALGNIIKDFAEGIAPGTTNFRNLGWFIEQSADDLEDLARIAGTFGEALLTMFVRSERQRREFFEWMQGLGDTLDRFANSSAFDTWLQRGTDVFGAIGGLLESTSQALADLVTDEAVDRLVNFLDTLSEAMPFLSDILETIGELDVFGLAAQAVRDLGEAIEPLLGPLDSVFDSVNRIVSIAIDQWTQDFGAAAEALAPFLDGIAGALSDMDEDVIRGIADALLILVGAGMAKKIAALAGSFSKLGKSAGGLALLAVAMAALNEAFANMDEEGPGESLTRMFDFAAAAAAVAGWVGAIVLGLSAAPAAIGAALAGLTAGLISTVAETWDDFDWEHMWDKNQPTLPTDSWLTAMLNDFNNGILNPFYEALGEGFEHGAEQIGTWLGQLGEAFANGWDNQIVPWFEETFQIAPLVETGLGSEGTNTAVADWWAGLMESFSNGWTQIQTFFTDLFTNITTWWNDGWANTVAAFANGWDQLSTWWTNLTTSVSTWFTTVFWPGVASWWNNGWTNTAAAFTNGWNQLVTWFTNLATSVSAWWTGTFWPGVVRWWNSGWATATRSFSNGWSQIVTWFTNLLTSVGNWWSNTFWPGVVRAWNAGWSAATSNFTSGWSLVSGWFGNLWADVSAWFSDFAGMVARAFSNAVSGLTGNFTSSVSVSGGGGGGGGGGGAASGTLALFPQRRLIGEDGPEAVVPLDRPLSRVDASVRWLSAIAQGKTGSGGGGMGPGGVVIEAGAVQVNGVLDPQRASLLVVNRLAERISG